MQITESKYQLIRQLHLRLYRPFVTDYASLVNQTPLGQGVDQPQKVEVMKEIRTVFGHIGRFHNILVRLL